MILDALVSQLNQRFQHEKRASVCLWFDERREFDRLLPALRSHLAGLSDAPFVLLEYDAELCRGQVWLKRQIAGMRSEHLKRKNRWPRFVLYLPMGEDRLNHQGLGGEPPLDLLTEYRFAGVTWRLGGKRPTLFAFLRQAGVPLSDSPAEQRRLYEGGRDSLLAKYVAKFIERPDAFWSSTLTPDLAQARLIGDIDQTILDLAVDPETTSKRLSENGLKAEFSSMVLERYGFSSTSLAPDDWIREFVASVAVTETFLGYSEPGDYPLAARLPPLTLRQHHIQLLHRWLRDTESRAAWDRWVQEVEQKIDLTSWARDKEGISFGFPHLVRLRWEQVRDAFEEVAGKASTTAEFFSTHRGVISREAEFAKASFVPVGSWALLRDLDQLVTACEELKERVGQASSLEALARLYVEGASRAELQHLRIRAQSEEQNLPSAAKIADRTYASFANHINLHFFQRLSEAGTLEIPGMPYITDRLEERLWKAVGKRALVIVDALRFDCAIAIRHLLRDQDVEIEPALAATPTITPVGMTALMPISQATVSVVIKGNGLHPIVNGRDTFVRANRLTYLKEFGADCREIAEIEGISEAPKGLGDLLVVFGHEEVDHIGHGHAQSLVRHMQLEVERLARLLRNLHRWGYPTVHVATDHGFILMDDERLPEEVPCDKDWCVLLKERFALVPASADLPIRTFPFRWDASLRLAFPPGMAFFKAEKSFSHGGATLQELVIPHLISKSYAVQEKRIGVEVVLPTFELMRTAVKVVLRPRSEADSGPKKQMLLFSETGRTLILDVLRTDPLGSRTTVVASGPKEVRLEPTDVEQQVTLFFQTTASFTKGELLHLDIRDVETGQQFPPGGVKLIIGRDM